jgi:type IV pilus assembly protein PilN
MIRVNLAPTTARRGGPGLRLTVPAFNLGLVFALVSLVAGAGGAGYWWTLSAEQARLTAEVDRASREIEALKATLGNTGNLREQVAELRKRVAAVQELTTTQARPVRLFDAFADTIPRDLWVTGLEDKGAVLRVTGSAFSTNAVADFMRNLRASGKFKDVDIVLSRQDLGKTPRLVTFEVTCRFEG